MNKFIIGGIIAFLLLSDKIFASNNVDNSQYQYLDNNGNYIGPEISYQGGPVSDFNLLQAFETAKQLNNSSILEMNDIERLFRLETGHFKSGQFADGFAAGMVASSSIYPFGWNSLSEWANLRGYSQNMFGTSQTFTVGGNNYKYVKFPDVYKSIDFVTWFIKNKRSGDVGKWYVLDTNSQGYKDYVHYLKNIKLRYTI